MLNIPKHITLPRLRKLDESLGYLDRFITPNVVIGESVSKVEVEKTALLKELAELNRKRFELMRDILA